MAENSTSEFKSKHIAKLLYTLLATGEEHDFTNLDLLYASTAAIIIVTNETELIGSNGEIIKDASVEAVIPKLIDIVTNETNAISLNEELRKYMHKDDEENAAYLLYSLFPEN